MVLTTVHNTKYTFYMLSFKLQTTDCKLKTTNYKGLLPLQRGPVESQEWRHTTIELDCTRHSVACIFQCKHFIFKCFVCSVYCVVCGRQGSIKWDLWEPTGPNK